MGGRGTRGFGFARARERRGAARAVRRRLADVRGCVFNRLALLVRELEERLGARKQTRQPARVHELALRPRQALVNPGSFVVVDIRLGARG